MRKFDLDAAKRGDDEPPTDSQIISGAIYDFAGYLTTRDTVIKIGASADAAPVADLIVDWANMRGLSLDGAAVSWWQDVLEESPKREWVGLTDEGLENVFPAIRTYTSANKDLYRSIARAVEAKLKEKNRAS